MSSYKYFIPYKFNECNKCSKFISTQCYECYNANLYVERKPLFKSNNCMKNKSLAFVKYYK